MAFRRYGWPAGSGRPPALSGLLQSEGVGSTEGVGSIHCMDKFLETILKLI